VPGTPAADRKRMRLSVVGTLAVALLAALGAVVPAAATGSTAIETLDTLDTAIVARINVIRQAHGLPPMRASARLGRAAHRHSRAMGMYGFFAHESRDGTSYRQRIRRDYPQGGYGVWSVGENLAFDSEQISAADAVGMWMGSPPHRAALLSKTWREIGVSALRVSSAPGIYEGDDVTLVTVDFGLRR
jgi:uncharacterized protein YkwD